MRRAEGDARARRLPGSS